MTPQPTLEELAAWPEHHTVHERAACEGDPRSLESAMTLVMHIASDIAQLLRGGHLEGDQADAVFQKLCSEIGAKGRR